MVSEAMIREMRNRQLLRDATDGVRLKALLNDKRKSYGSLKYEEIVLLCKLFGIEEEDSKHEEL